MGKETHTNSYHFRFKNVLHLQINNQYNCLWEITYKKAIFKATLNSSEELYN